MPAFNHLRTGRFHSSEGWGSSSWPWSPVCASCQVTGRFWRKGLRFPRSLWPGGPDLWGSWQWGWSPESCSLHWTGSGQASHTPALRALPLQNQETAIRQREIEAESERESMIKDPISWKTQLSLLSKDTIYSQAHLDSFIMVVMCKIFTVYIIWPGVSKLLHTAKTSWPDLIIFGIRLFMTSRLKIRCLFLFNCWLIKKINRENPTPHPALPFGCPWGWGSRYQLCSHLAPLWVETPSLGIIRGFFLKKPCHPHNDRQPPTALRSNTNYRSFTETDPFWHDCVCVSDWSGGECHTHPIFTALCG